MWLFVGISLAIATPCFRAWLEALFAELTIIFFTYLGLVSLALTSILLLALVFHGRRFLRTRWIGLRSNSCHVLAAGSSNTKPAAKTALARVRWKRRGTKRRALMLCVKSTTSEMAGSGFYLPQLWTSSLFALAMLPIINSVMVGGGGGGDGRKDGDTLSSLRSLKSETITAQTAIDADIAALLALQQQLTTCKYSKDNECLDNVTAISVLGDYRQARGYCTAFDAAYVNVTTGTALPSQYFPIGVEDANAQGFANNFSAWSNVNQENFRMDCPLLYNETISGEGQELLCCTEKQYETMSLQVRKIPGQCTSCKENLRNLWCQFTCHPSNSLFVDVTQVRLMVGDTNHTNQVFPAIEEATYYVGSDMVRDLHDYCEADSSFMPLVCDMTENKCSTTGLDMLEFLGAYSLDGVGFPMQVNFVTMEQLSTAEQKEKICECGSTNTSDCFAPMDTRLESCVGSCGRLCAVDATDSRQYESACYTNGNTSASDDLLHRTSQRTNSSKRTDTANKIDTFLSELSSRAQASNFTILNYALAVLAFVATTALALGLAYSTRYGKRMRHSVLDDPANRSMGTGVLSLVNLHQPKSTGHWDDWLTQQFKRWGDFVAMGNHPMYIILLSLMVIVCCSSGLVRLEVETDPLKLWVSESSAVFQQRSRFNAILGPLDRVERLVLAAKDGGPVIRPAYLKEAIRLQQIVENDITSDNITLGDVCFKDALTAACHIHAVTQFFQNNMDHFEIYETYDLVHEHLKNCVNAPERTDVNVCNKLRARLNSSESAVPASMMECPCLSSFGVPMTEMRKYLGGNTARDASQDAVTYLQQATALYSTALVMNYQDPAKNSDAIAWEHAFIKRMEQEARTNSLYDIFYAAETSADDEAMSASSMNAVLKAGFASFISMFIFVGIGPNCRKLNHHFFYSSRIGVGLLGVACILMSVSATLGIFAWIGVKLKVVTLVVLPLMVLAIGAGNISLILHALDLKQEELVMEQRSLFVELEDNDFGIHEITCVLLCEATGHVGPSIITAAVSECCIVAFAAYSAMPTAQWLAGSLVVAIAANVALQLTLFLAIVALDKRRELSGTYDVLCCKRVSFVHRPRLSDFRSAAESSSYPGSWYSSSELNLVECCINSYTQVLLKKISKVFVLLFFATCSLVAIMYIETMDRGLSPISFIPSTSYLHAFYRAVDDTNLSRKEFPVYFVVEGGYGNNPHRFNSLANDADAQRKCCNSKQFCDELSIPNILSALVAHGESNVTFFENNAVVDSWLDDFWHFIDPDTECCRVNPEQAYSYLPLRPEDSRSSEGLLKRASLYPSCLADASKVLSVPPESFMSLFTMFSTTDRNPLCPFAAGTRYRGQLSIDNRAIPTITSTAALNVTLNGTSYGNNITAFAYKVMSTTVDSISSQEKAITAFSQAKHIAKWISKETGIDVWIFSPNYIFLDQFHSVRRAAYFVVSAALVLVFGLQSAVLGSFWYGFAVTFIAAVTVIQVAGLMVPMGVPLNSLSIVCLSIAIIFSVEFSGHFTRLFAKARTISDEYGYLPLGDACVKKVLTQLLPSSTLSILSKFIAIASLLFAPMPLFKPAGYCFFQLFVAGAMCSWLNSVVLLPVGLSIAVDATEGRVRDVKSTTEEGDEYSRESPSSSYCNAPLSGKY